MHLAQCLHPEAPNRRYIFHMSDSANQDDVDSLVSNLQQGNDALSADSQALDQAARLAAEIAGEIHASEGAAPPLRPESGDPASGATPDAATPEVGTANRGGTPDAQGGPNSPDVQRLLAIEVPVIVQLGTRRMTVGEVMRFAVGAIIEFSKSAEEELELLVSNKPIGKGHAVKVGENFGIKLTRIGSVKEMIRKLGAT
jgi:flagellar motor switch protein FliN